ncbi:MAG: T9SS type A sorting domain-containing protein [Calditrichaeota bacterium]|nr:T9SS type A sorting domain-containing protein [Calditrichota bacterium]
MRVGVQPLCRLLLPILLCLSVPLQAAQLAVPQDYPTIQEAVDQAAIDDTVAVSPGLYPGSVYLSHRIHLLGLGQSPAETVLDAQGRPYAVHCSYFDENDPGFRIENLTLTGASIVALDYSSGRHLRILRCLLVGNPGGAIHYQGVSILFSCQLSILQSTIAGNGLVDRLIDLTMVSQLTIQRSIIAGNPGAAEIYVAGQLPGMLIQYTNHFERAENSWSGLLAPYAGISGNISADPLFIDPEGDYRLAAGSPCLPPASPSGETLGAMGEGPGLPGFSALFWADPYSPWFPSEVAFHHLDSSQELLYEWDTDGDGVYDKVGTHPRVNYEGPGLFDVTLRVTDLQGREERSSVEGFIQLGGRRLRVPGDYPSLAAALAVTIPGDSVLLDCGTYLEHDLIVGNGVTIGSVDNDPDCVILDGQGLGRILDARATDSLCVRGITFRNGWTLEEGGAIASGDRLELQNCRFQLNSANSGGALSGSDYSSRTSIVRGCEFERNLATVAGGAAWQVNGDWSDCRFVSNSAVQIGGALNSGGSLNGGVGDLLGVLESCLFQDNRAALGGAVFAGDLEASGCDFINNEASESGGALKGGSLELEDCRFIGNRSQGNGGAIDASIVFGPRRLRLRDTLLHMNQASGLGGAIHGTNTSLELFQCTLAWNLAAQGSQIHGSNLGPYILATKLQLLRSIVVPGGTGHPFVLSYSNASQEPPLVQECDLWSPDGFDWYSINEFAGVNGNLELDPLFCDPGTGDLHLLPGSPCRHHYNDDAVDMGYSTGSCYPVSVTPTALPEALALTVAPNPFNSRTLIAFELPRPGIVRLDVHDLLGRRVLRVIQEPLSAGEHRVPIDCAELASGVYILRLRTPDAELARRMLVLK